MSLKTRVEVVEDETKFAKRWIQIQLVVSDRISENCEVLADLVRSAGQWFA